MAELPQVLVGVAGVVVGLLGVLVGVFVTHRTTRYQALQAREVAIMQTKLAHHKQLDVIRTEREYNAIAKLGEALGQIQKDADKLRNGHEEKGVPCSSSTIWEFKSEAINMLNEGS